MAAVDESLKIISYQSAERQTFMILGHAPGHDPRRSGKGGSCIFCEKILRRLQQPVQNPKSDNTNVLWNSPSLGKNYSYRLLLVL